MQIDPQTNAERQVVRKNRLLEQRYLFLHHAGILAQVVKHWTVERHRALQGLPGSACGQHERDPH